LPLSFAILDRMMSDVMKTSEPNATGRFAEALREWGPEKNGRQTLSPAEAEEWCRRLARSHNENFLLVSWLLPRGLRQHFFNVYAYCRWADDLADEIADCERSLELLAWWRDELAACYGGEARHPVFVALSRTIAECSIPQQPFADLISAFEQDQRVFGYDTFAQLRDYCRRSADPVGRLVLHVCGEFTDEQAAWSDSICTGLQLANFWQDVARDLDMGRVYLPREDCERFGYTREQLESRLTNEAFVELMRFEVDRAREFLKAGMPLVPRLPGRLQVDIDLFARGGLKILDRIEQIGYRVWEQRPVVTKRDAAGLLAGSLCRRFWRGVGGSSRRREID
jgi:squalene synthase HpnC